MKRIISALLAAVILLSLCGTMLSCGNLTDIALDAIGSSLSDGVGENGTAWDEPDTDIPDDGGIDQPPSAGPADAEPPEDEYSVPEGGEDSTQTASDGEISVTEDGEYDDAEHVALYIHIYGKLPSNYMTKKEAESLGWTGGALDTVVEGKAIGGSFFGNYEGILPKKEGREYRECDIDTIGEKSRGSKRIVYSNDGLVYYTNDHYETFTLLYGEE